MLKNLYKRFNNEHFSAERYRQVLTEIFSYSGDPCVRMCETPVFVSRSFAGDIVRGAVEIIQQSLNPSLKNTLEKAVFPGFRIPLAPKRPSFFIIDFAVTRDSAGQMVPRLIEMQGFAANLAFIPAAAKIYKDVYALGEGFDYFLSGSAEEAVRETILGGHAPENVVLMEINPWEQKSRRDFIATQRQLGIPVIDVTEVIKKGDRLFYHNEKGQETRIHRIYSRIIPTEFQSLHLSEKTQFKFTDKLDVEWAGDPGWFLKISKYTMPYLDHPMVPETRFLDQVAEYPRDLENYVLKPVFFNAGRGIRLDITKEDLDAIPVDDRHHYILMRKVNFIPFIPDPEGNMLNAEIRVMLVWPDKSDNCVPVALSARVMRGNDTNESLWGNHDWCGMAPVFIVDKEDI